jgi:hypothetical protein
MADVRRSPQAEIDWEAILRILHGRMDLRSIMQAESDE